MSGAYQQQAPLPCEPESQTAGRGRSELVQEVVRLAEEASLQAKEERGRKPKLSREERQFRQSSTPNLYVLLQEISELALLDLSVCQIRNTEEQLALHLLSPLLLFLTD